MGTPRDRVPYCEPTAGKPVPQFALQNLTLDDLMVLQDVLATRCALHYMRARDPQTPPNVAARSRAAGERIDALVTAIKNRHHVPATEPGAQA